MMKDENMRRGNGLGVFLLCMLCLGVYAVTVALAGDGALLEDRVRLLELVKSESADAVPALMEALDDERELMNLTAVHLSVSMGESGLEAVEKALEHPNIEVRRRAIHGLAQMDRVDDYWPVLLMDEHTAIQMEVKYNLLENHPLPEGEAWERLLADLAEMYADAPASRRRHVVDLFTEFERMTPQSRRVLILATRDQDDNVRKLAFEGILDHVERDWEQAGDLMNLAMSDVTEDIQDIGLEMQWKLLEVEQVRMPRDGWRFKKDPDEAGRDLDWYDPGYDDSEWREDVPIESSWKNFVEDYNGVGWYRRTFEVPELPEWDRAYLHFEGVDEQAWVWLNGQYVGSHELGMEGWNVPFVLDVADVMKPGEVNHIAVRAANTTGAAGIWRPVRLRVLDSTAIEGSP